MSSAPRSSASRDSAANARGGGVRANKLIGNAGERRVIGDEGVEPLRRVKSFVIVSTETLIYCFGRKDFRIAASVSI